MTDDNRPLSELVTQGWEILNYSSSYDSSGVAVESKLKMHRILSVRPKMLGKGYVVKEFDV